MPAEAVGFFEDLLARRDHHIDLALAAAFVTLDDESWFERTFASVMKKRPLAIAVTLAPALRRLRDSGRGDRAEAIRTRLVPVIAAGEPERPMGRPLEQPTDAIDVLDAFSAPGMPTCTPFGHELP